MLTPPDLCLGHGEQASNRRARRASRQVVWVWPGIEASQQGTSIAPLSVVAVI